MINLKYPRTPHLPFSPSRGEDDIESDSLLSSEEPLLLTEKMDGANIALSRNEVYSRSGKPASKKMFDKLKAYHAQISYLIPDKYLLYGEWLSTPHTIIYENLPDPPLMLFASRYIDKSGIGNQITGGFKGDVFESFGSVEYWAKKIGVNTVPNLGIVPDNNNLRKYIDDLVYKSESSHEGFVIRSAEGFSYSQFQNNVAKYVVEGFEPGINL